MLNFEFMYFFFCICVVRPTFSRVYLLNTPALRYQVLLAISRKSINTQKLIIIEKGKQQMSLWNIYILRRLMDKISSVNIWHVLPPGTQSGRKFTDNWNYFPFTLPNIEKDYLHQGKIGNLTWRREKKTRHDKNVIIIFFIDSVGTNVKLSF